jgi:hypothetical protein
MDKILQKQMAFNEKLNKLLEDSEEKTLNYDIVLRENSEFRKHNTLSHVKFKALLMKEKNVDLWCNAI